MRDMYTMYNVVIYEAIYRWYSTMLRSVYLPDWMTKIVKMTCQSFRHSSYIRKYELTFNVKAINM